MYFHKTIILALMSFPAFIFAAETNDAPPKQLPPGYPWDNRCDCNLVLS